MTASTIRKGFLATVLLLGLALAAAGCHVHAHGHGHPYYDYDIAFDVHNDHGAEIWIEAIDWDGYPEDLGSVYPGETVTFVVSDWWDGHLLYAHCILDGAVVDSEIAFDGLYWVVY